jgi:peptidoglycan hydrolase-like protein with peptidoglycan-binding domain
MTRTTTLMTLGLLIAGSTPALAQQMTTASAEPAPQQHAVAPTTHQTAQAAATVPATPPADTAWVWEASASGRSPAQIKEVETWLAQLNLLKPYDPYDPGRMTPDTEDAVRQFQRTHNLPVTGQISDTLMTLLHRAALSAGLPACQ